MIGWPKKLIGRRRMGMEKANFAGVVSPPI